VGSAAEYGDARYFLGAAEFPLNDHALPGEMWDFLRVKEWRFTASFTDTSEGDRPNQSGTQSHVFEAGTISEQGWLTDDIPFLNEYGSPWGDLDEVIRSNGYVNGSPYGPITAGLHREVRVLHTFEDDDSEYFYKKIGIGIGQPTLFRPLLLSEVPVGGTLGEWGWVIPINAGSAGGGGAFGGIDGDAGPTVYYNGVPITRTGATGGENWTITLTEEGYFE